MLKHMGYLHEFKEFLLKQNALALAIGVVIGGAIGKVVTGVVNDIFMPIVGSLLPLGEDWKKWESALNAKNSLKVGDLLGSIVDFVIIAAVVFLVTKTIIKEKPKPVTTRACPECEEVIPLTAKRCRACTAVVVPAV